VYILDLKLSLVPLGAVGELYIGGAGLACGYLNRPDLTAERFIPNLFSPGPGKRLYRSGDLGLYRAYDDIEYIGRADHQVKIRGFRIELGEIESQLRRHSEVREAIVALGETPNEDKQLIAYVAPRAFDHQLSRQLREFLKNRLPDYMIPSG